MHKIVIADDEYLERKALGIILKERCGINDIEIVGKAAKGEEAVEFAVKNKADIIFIDIKMPGMNGLQAIKKIKAELPEAKFVILTAYDEFEYVQEALKLNIEEYLLKPVKPEKVKAVIISLIKKIEASRKEEKLREKMKEKLDMVIPYIKMSFVFDLIFLNIDTVEEIKSRTEFFDIDELPSAVMIADIDKFARTTVNQDEVRRQLHKKEVFSVIKNFAAAYSSLMIVPMSSDKIVILYFGEKKYQNKQIKNWLRQTAEQMVEDIRRKTDFTITIGIGSYYDDPRMVDRSYYEALGAIRNSILVGKKSVIHWEDIKNNDYEDVAYPYDIETKLIEKLKTAKTEQLSELIDTFFENWQLDDNFDSMMVKSRILELLGVLSRSAVEAGAKYIDISPLNYKYTQELFKISTINALKKWLYSLVIKFIEKVDEVEEEDKEKIIYDGVKYIQSNFTDDISLTDAAAAASLSIHYFSRLFKKEMGCTFKEYLTELRMREAKKKLKNRDDNIANIAKAIGYNNPGYFSKVFKKYEGMPPSEFRDF
ncbi:MAG: helix-turn-helix domain-containing protein [Halanaerobium sp.]